jgi:plastocyanin
MCNRLIRQRDLFLIVFCFFILSLIINESSAEHALSATPIDQYTVYLNWTAHTPPPFKTTYDYEVRFKEPWKTDYTNFNDGVSINTYATVTGLKKGTTYDFQVRALFVEGGRSNIGENSATTPKIDPISQPDPPKISGVGFYSISITNSEKPYAQSESYTRKPNTRFEDFFPYSKFSDQLDREKYGSPINYGKSGQYFFTEGYATSVPTLFGEVNQPVQIQVRITDETNIFKVNHLSLYTNVRGERSDKQFSNLYVVFDKGSPLQIFDPMHYLKDVNVQTSIENDQLWLIFDFVFQKPMRKSDILLESWNEGRIPVYAKIVDAWQISEPKQLEPTEIPLNAEIEITHNAASPVCKADNSCFAPFEVKLLTGGTVTWTNIDSFIHTITSGTPQYKDGKFAKYVYPTRSVKFAFDKPGTYPYFCELHPWATGKISVSDVNVISSIKEPVAQSTLIVKSITSAGSLLIENDDYVYLNEKSLTIEISGHIEDVTHGAAVDFVLKRPDRSFEKFKVITNKEGYYKTVTVLDKKWQSGSYTIFAKHNEKIVGNISFVIMEPR